MRQIEVETSQVLKTAEKIEEAKVEYQQLYYELYEQVDLLASSWSGKDNQAFTTQIKAYEEDFRKIAVIMTQYSEFLRNSARAYQSMQEELSSQANRLRT